jgi:dTDP-4-amino-4,6-dideoxygalactose transaminase
MTENIPVFSPLIQEDEIQAATESLRRGWLGMGKYVGHFEEALGKAIGAEGKHVVALATGHAALHLGLMLAGVGPGDEVITPSFNNIADFQAILAVGAEPVFCDIDPDTLCLDLAQAETLIGQKTKAIIVMDYDCILCDHDRIKELADKYNLRVIHDAAHSLGSKYKGRPVGSFSDICMFSFDPVKTITCIDGGALVVNTEQEKQALHEMRLIGMGQPASVMYQNKRAWTYEVSRLGFRYHMANLHAAIGIQQLTKLDEIRQTRVNTCMFYNKELSQIDGIMVPKSDFKDICPFLYYIRVAPESRDDLRAHLLEDGVDTGIHWQPGHWFELFKNCRAGSLTVTEAVGKEVLSLPLHSNMSKQASERVVSSIKGFYAKQGMK